MRTRVKICCIASREEAALAVSHGADAVGLVSAMPSGPGPIPEARIARIAAGIPPGVAAVLLTSLREPEAIAAQQRRCGAGVIQLCRALPDGAHAALRAALPGVRLVQVVHVRGEDSVDVARRAAATADGLLLDSGDPDAAVPTLGGTGRTHDWTVSRRIRQAVDRPVFLAGGLTPDNVAAAIRAVEPFGVDVCSGVRIDGRLDPARLRAFMAAVSAADAGAGGR
jgi:phosphoribosylanthranilate isomerase